MSTVYFHSLDHDDGEVRGSERAYMHCMVNDLSISHLTSGISNYSSERPEILKFIHEPEKLYFHNDRNIRFKESFDLALRVGMSDIQFVVDDKKIHSSSLLLNTAMTVGNDVVKLMARLHAQCELHAYVLPKNFPWLSQIIEWGLKNKILREGQGWDSVLELLSVSKSPIVTSYSVCDRFPTLDIDNYSSGCLVIPFDEEEVREHWDDLSYEERWKYAWDKLLVSGGCREIKPDDWDEYYFGEKLTAFDLQ